MSLFEKEHDGAGLADASSDAERDLVLDDGLMIGSLSQSSWPVICNCVFKGFCVHTDAADMSSWRRRVTGFQTRMSPLSPCIGLPLSETVSVTQSS